MAGRGRGRGGRGRGMTFSLEQLGIQKGEVLPGPISQPPPLFPPLEKKPVPLSVGLEEEYMLVVKKEFAMFMKDSPFFIVPAAQKRDIERYSDKYHQGNGASNRLYEESYDWGRVPRELRPPETKRRKRKRSSQGKDGVKPAAPSNLKLTKRRSLEDVTKALDELEKKEGLETEKVKEEKEQKDEEEKENENSEEDDDEFEDEELDDGTDYVNSYFDNGEGYLEEDEDNLDDGPTY